MEDFHAMPFQDLIDKAADGSLPVRIGRVFPLDRIIDAHRLMENNAAAGKIVVVTGQTGDTHQ
ncbi:NADPH:quinone reductase-like Zn-dependent oxidoreductase [Sphingomonas sp. BK069]|nr:NADPH:quinone reductase-like Zn-dependent oxidoreductase [Sphingomonas sp. BK069]